MRNLFKWRLHLQFRLHKVWLQSKIQVRIKVWKQQSKLKMHRGVMNLKNLSAVGLQRQAAALVFVALWLGAASTFIAQAQRLKECVVVCCRLCTPRVSDSVFRSKHEFIDRSCPSVQSVSLRSSSLVVGSNKTQDSWHFSFTPLHNSSPRGFLYLEIKSKKIQILDKKRKRAVSETFFYAWVGGSRFVFISWPGSSNFTIWMRISKSLKEAINLE